MAKRRTRERLRHYTIDFKIERRCGFEEEPDEFVTDIDGTIRFESEEEEVVKVGVIQALVVRARAAEDRGQPLIEVCDAHSSVACEFFATLFDVDSELPKPALLTLLPNRSFSDILVIANIEIVRQHRGFGLGLVAVERVIETFGGSCGFVALEPRPLQFFVSTEEDDWTRELKLDKFIRDEALAMAALGRYWHHLGFVQVAGTTKLVLPLKTMRPTLADALEVAAAPAPKESTTLQ